MSFHSTPIAIGTADTLIFECPATLEGSVHGLQFENYSAGAVDLTIKLFKYATGATSTVRFKSIPAGEEYEFTKINVSAGDRVIAAAASAGAIRALANAYVDAATPVAVGFAARGAWLIGSAYAVNDVVTHNGTSYIARVAHSGSQPPSANWMVLAEKGDQGPAGVGAGDMQVATYDPGGIGADVFDMDNMKESATRKILSNSERIKLGGVAAGATANDTDANLRKRDTHTGTQSADTITGLATVAITGAYSDLGARPSLGTAAALNTGTSAGNVPVLDGAGLLNSAVLPAIAITDVFEVASQSAMLALTAQRGDIAIRTDLNRTFALATNSPTTLADWKELRTPTDVVLAVAGLTGTITAEALKAALAIVVADIGDMSANGRSLVTAADYVAMRALLGLVIGTDVQAYDANTAKLNAAQTFSAAQKFGRVAGAIATTSGTAFNNANGNEHTRTVSANTTYTVSNVPVSGDVFHMRVLLSYTSGTITWFSGIQWVGGTAPTFTSGKMYEIILTTQNGGTTWRGVAGEYGA